MRASTKLTEIQLKKPQADTVRPRFSADSALSADEKCLSHLRQFHSQFAVILTHVKVAVKFCFSTYLFPYTFSQILIAKYWSMWMTLIKHMPFIWIIWNGEYEDKVFTKQAGQPTFPFGANLANSVRLLFIYPWTKLFYELSISRDIKKR